MTLPLFLGKKTNKTCILTYSDIYFISMTDIFPPPSLSMGQRGRGIFSYQSLLLPSAGKQNERRRGSLSVSAGQDGREEGQG